MSKQENTVNQGKATAKHREEIREAILSSLKDGRLACAKAHHIAEELGVPVRMVGQVAQQEKVKIVHCELGCF